VASILGCLPVVHALLLRRVSVEDAASVGAREHLVGARNK